MLLAVLNLPVYNQHTGPSADAASIPAVHDMLSQLASLDGKHTLLLDTHGLRFGEPWDAALVNGLDRRGHEIVVDDPVTIRQYGTARAFDGHADGELVIEEGDNAMRDYPGMSRAILHVDLDAAEQAERLELQSQIGDMLASGGLRLTPDGQQAVTDGKIAALVQPADGVRPDPVGFSSAIRSETCSPIVGSKWIRRGRNGSRAYADLQHRWNFQTVGVFVGPVQGS